MIRTIILLIFGASLLIMALRSLRAMRLKERYVLLYLFLGLPFIVLAAWPDAVVWLSNLLVIEKPTLLVLCLTVFTIVSLLKLLSIVSMQERKIATLTQLVGILSEERARLGEQPADDGVAQDSPHAP